jgi:Protein of unknown function (DUF1572)
MDIGAAYLKDVLRMYRNYKALGEGALAQVRTDDDLNRLIDPDANSIAIIVKHVSGNLRSRFRDFLTSDGEKPDRNRDGEFESDGAVSRDAIMSWWNEGWAVAMPALESLSAEDLSRTIHIRGEAFLVVEALGRSITHTAYHVGQIVTLARHFAGAEWRTLSIPRGQSRSVAGDFKTRGIAR